jgi:hypothetical protein
MVSLRMIAVTTVLALTFFEVSRDFGVPTATAFVGTAVWALSPPVLSHGYVFFTEIPTALTALVIFRPLRNPEIWSR